MKKFYLQFLFPFCYAVSGWSQSVTDAAVQLSASVQSSPAQITISWLPSPNSTQYQVFRKLKGATTWGAVVAVLNSSASQYVDNTVSAATSYEYRVSVAGTNYSGHGYINAGIEIPETHFRGKLLLLVDSTVVGSLSAELNRLSDDLEGDGWEVIRHDLDRNGSVQHVKGIIVSDYNADPLNTKAVFIFGHLPVPYSGFLNPDGHTDHFGAWPADVYYGDMNGTWTDVNGPGSSTASPPRTENNPGDGKFDQTAISGLVELQVGRVDLADMPAFTSAGNELQLLKNYLDKDHAYRKKLTVPRRRAVIDDNFGYFSAEAFAASGYKNFAPLLGPDSIAAGDYITSLNSGSYLWSYGCGGGYYTSASGVGNTFSIASSTLQGIFSMLFGSYFGDWDVSNSFLRAPLASGSMLTNVWSGRPHYQFHHMALGENIGYSLLTTQNYSGGLYFGSPYAITGKWVHNALMGDPTLRHDVVSPVSNVVATKSGYHCIISWSSSPETALTGYNIYMRNDTNTGYVKINTSPVTGTSYTHHCLSYKGIYKYMVRALKLEDTPSGTYYNMSEGIADTALNNSDIAVHAGFSAIVSGSVVNIVNTSTNALSYSWDFGNATSGTVTNPSTSYTANGVYTINLVALGACTNAAATATISICNWLASASFSAHLGNDTLYLTNTSQNANNYFWDLGNGYTSNAVSPVTTFTSGGVYTVMLVAVNDCGSDSSTTTVVYDPVALDELKESSQVVVYPNPATNFLHIRSDLPFSLNIVNSAGQRLSGPVRYPGTTLINTSGLQNGVYFLHIEYNGSQKVISIIKN